MNLEFLPTLLAIDQQGSLAAAGEALGLTHSAVSLRVKSIEDAIGKTVLDRSARPATLTPVGEALLVHAREIERLRLEVANLGRSDDLQGLLRLGAVPTSLSKLVARALSTLRDRHPSIEIHVKSGLSGELALALRQGEIDIALVSEPALPLERYDQRLVAEEPLCLIAASQVETSKWQDVLRREPYIWFSRKTWAGQKIERLLLERQISVNATMEVDSLEAIIGMVRYGLGVAIVPASISNPGWSDGLSCFEIGVPGFIRRLVLLSRRADPKTALHDALATALREAS